MPSGERGRSLDGSPPESVCQYHGNVPDRAVPADLSELRSKYGAEMERRRKLTMDALQIHPGIVVGQLAFRQQIGYSHSREMLEKVRDVLVDSALTDG